MILVAVAVIFSCALSAFYVLTTLLDLLLVLIFGMLVGVVTFAKYAIRAIDTARKIKRIEKYIRQLDQTEKAMQKHGKLPLWVDEYRR